MTFQSNGPGEMTLGVDDRAAALGEVKAALNLVSGSDDALLVIAIETALAAAEHFIGRVMIARDVIEWLPASAAWQSLGAAPVRSIGSVSLLVDGAPLALAVADHAIDIDADATGWVRLVVPRRGVIEVAYQAGWAEDWDALAAPIRQGAVLAAGHLYITRFGPEPPPAAIEALWRPFRAATLAGAVRA